jgi:hypothetical protein
MDSFTTDVPQGLDADGTEEDARRADAGPFGGGFLFRGLCSIQTGKAIGRLKIG